MKTQLNNFRIGAALSIPMVIAAGTVALAGYLFTSDVTTAPAGHDRGHVVVLDDGQIAAQASGPRVIVLDDQFVAAASAPSGHRG